jgi:predicted outer membrane protein
MKPLVWMAALAALVVTGCATTYNPAAETTTTAPATPTTMPQGDFNSLIVEMRDRFERLAEEMSTNERNDARRTLAEIEALWVAMEDEVADRGRQFADDLRRIVDFAVTSVTRNRPADAGKGLRFIDLFIATQ